VTRFAELLPVELGRLPLPGPDNRLAAVVDLVGDPVTLIDADRGNHPRQRFREIRRRLGEFTKRVHLKCDLGHDVFGDRPGQLLAEFGVVLGVERRAAQATRGAVGEAERPLVEELRHARLVGVRQRREAAYAEGTPVVWVQEEPRNMGARAFMSPRLLQILPEPLHFGYIGRPERAASGQGHPIAQEMLKSGELLVEWGAPLVGERIERARHHAAGGAQYLGAFLQGGIAPGVARQLPGAAHGVPACHGLYTAATNRDIDRSLDNYPEPCYCETRSKVQSHTMSAAHN